MFDHLASGELAEADDAALLGAVEGWARAESAAAARRLAAIGELVERRCADDVDESRALWSCDLWDATAAEVGAALNVSPRRASSQMHLARSLRDRLPRINALFLTGRLTARLVSTISWRTHLVLDDTAMSAIDAGLARQATAWGPLSDNKVEQAIDALVDEHDPQAREWFRQAARGLDVEFGKPEDATGTRSMWGRLYATHAELVERRLAVMARGVCSDDPRSIGQLRAEAMGAVFAGFDRIACRCGKSDCPNAEGGAAAAAVVVHVVAEQRAVDSAVVAAEPDVATPVARRPAAVMAAGGIVPSPLLAELIRGGAKIIPLSEPCEPAESRYRPSAQLQRFVRCRDLTCRFPGCDAPAETCDFDHAIAYPVGPTHPSNLRCLCRKHHLLKTFWVGADGWSDRQLPDGTIVWTAPSGRDYTTRPGSRIFFPRWNVTTAELPSPGPDAPSPGNRGLQMPLRRRTRAAEYTARIKNRRAHNDSS